MSPRPDSADAAGSTHILPTPSTRQSRRSQSNPPARPAGKGAKGAKGATIDTGRIPRIGALMRLASQKLTEQHQLWLQQSGYSDLQPAHSAVFHPLWESHPHGARLTALARASRITKQSMSVLVDHLHACGYVERTADPGDARASLVTLTSKGTAFVTAIRAYGEAVEADWSRRVGAHRVDELKTTLNLLRQSWLSED